MIIVCPNPKAWDNVYKRLCRYAERHSCTPPKPPIPLILAGWNFSSDFQKMRRWEEMKQWAVDNGCPSLVEGVPDIDFYRVHAPSDDDGCGFAQGSRLPIDNPSRERPSAEALSAYLEALNGGWVQIAGPVLAEATRPIGFSGDKARGLIVAANPAIKPPWGQWAKLSPVAAERLSFTKLRAAINKAIAPHEVDHVLFDTAHWVRHVGSTTASEP